MDAFAQFWPGLSGHSPSSHWLAVALAAAGVYAVGLCALFIVARRFDPLRRRMDALAGQARAPAPAAEPLAGKLRHLSAYWLPGNQRLRSGTLDRLNHAGYRSPNRLAVYYLARLALMALLPALALLAAPWLPGVGLPGLPALASAAFALGMVAPSYYLDRKVAVHQALLRRALPDAIDLLVVCTEAGLGLNAALLRVALALADIHPALAEELLLVNSEIRAGVDRIQALTNLAQRSGLEDIKGLAALLGQGMRFGTSVAQTLRAYSEEFRDKRMQKADEEAAKLPTKMIFPLVLCFLPGFFIVALGPAIVNVAGFLPGLGP